MTLHTASPADSAQQVLVPLAAWSSIWPYAEGDYVISGGSVWLAVDPVLGVAPAAAAWTEVVGGGGGGLPAGLTYVSPCFTVGADVDNVITVCGSSGSGLANPTTIVTADADQAASITIQPGASNDMLGNNGGDLVLSSGGPPAAPGQLLLQAAGVTVQALGLGVTTANGIFQVGGDVQNQVVITGSTTGNPVTLSAAGVDTDVDLLISSQGAGVVNISTGASGSFTTVDLKTVTVLHGIITSIV